MLIPTHTLFGVLALASGAVVFFRRKGDRAHRLAGGVYAVSMLLLCGGSYWIQDSTPFFQGLGPFHVAATVSLVTLLFGLWAVRWSSAPPASRAAGHVRSMVWSYVGLAMATGSHLISPVGRGLVRGLSLDPSTAFPLAMALCWGVPPLVTVLALRRRGAELEARFVRILEAKTARFGPGAGATEAV